ncbi:FaeA/PapI family transcriptional regulator [Escherichia coli]|uniref:FaeA/PapI family transcriptional regulator n=1 Tax=Escherichia coli TaxID=562 RepID=UPI002E17A385|nr:FaeA/PapI family transcriptional regulator [Escherichia coli]MEC5283316.1 FaeA/PapI family transcriptional regulator [Escherichia coli]
MNNRYHSETIKDRYEQVITFMKKRNASVKPLKTREVADACNMTVYMALNYLRELNRLGIVEPDRRGKGCAICWYLVN